MGVHVAVFWGFLGGFWWFSSRFSSWVSAKNTQKNSQKNSPTWNPPQASLFFTLVFMLVFTLERIPIINIFIKFMCSSRIQVLEHLSPWSAECRLTHHLHCPCLHSQFDNNFSKMPSSMQESYKSYDVVQPTLTATRVQTWKAPGHRVSWAQMTSSQMPIPHHPKSLHCHQYPCCLPSL